MLCRLVICGVSAWLFACETMAADVSATPPEIISYDSLTAWHNAGGLSSYHWPRRQEADLNDDHMDEVLLGTSGYGRGMFYALFTKTKSGWILLSEEISGSHHNPIPLPAIHDGWHDFEFCHPTGRGGLWQSIYTWNGKRYVEKSCLEITEKELFPDLFPP